MALNYAQGSMIFVVDGGMFFDAKYDSLFDSYNPASIESVLQRHPMHPKHDASTMQLWLVDDMLSSIALYDVLRKSMRRVKRKDAPFLFRKIAEGPLAFDESFDTSHGVPFQRLNEAAKKFWEYSVSWNYIFDFGEDTSFSYEDPNTREKMEHQTRDQAIAFAKSES